MQVVEAVTKIPILRPLVTYDKQEIIDIAKRIGTYETSIRPFNDCCSIYVPKSPVTKPMEVYALKYEENIDYDTLILEAIKNVKTLEISSATTLVISDHGFTVEESLATYEKEMMPDANHIQTK